jgi:hypothetical protein
MRALLILLLIGILDGCSIPTAVVRSQVVSYDDAIEDITNKLLVLNILRARDKAPMHFDEIPSIHETVQATAAWSGTYPYGPRPAMSPGRNTMTPSVNLQIAPSFEIDHLDTKDFVTGLSSPIDPKYVKYWLDRGLDRRIVLMLFFSAADIVHRDASGHSYGLRIRNSPREAVDFLKQQARAGSGSSDLQCDLQSEFQRFLKLINSLRTFAAHSATERRMLADHLTLHSSGEFKDLTGIASLDTSKYQWVRHADNSYTIYAISAEPRTTFCFSNLPIRLGSADKASGDACLKPTVDVTPEEDGSPEQTPLAGPPGTLPSARSDYCTNFEAFLASLDGAEGGADTGTELRLQIRSVGEIIQFLGDLLQYQDTLTKFFHDSPEAVLKLNNPLTFGYCPDQPPDSRAGCSDIFFDLRHETCNARFSLSYRGRRYSVPNFDPPAEDASCEDSHGSRAPESKDHTLEVLAVVHQLIDLQKSAQDIRETPYVQIVP